MAQYQDIYYYSAPKGFEDKPKDLSEVDPKLIETYNKLEEILGGKGASENTALSILSNFN